jgi:hypothetical protein
VSGAIRSQPEFEETGAIECNASGLQENGDGGAPPSGHYIVT